MPAPPPVDDDLFEQAVHWVLRLDAAPADPDLQREQAAWLAVDPAQRGRALASARQLLGLLQAPAAAVGDELGIEAAAPAAARPAAAGPARPRGGPRPRRWAPYAAAATLVLALVSGSWLQLGGLDRLRSDAHTGIGEIRRLALPDGSVVTLDTDSAVSVRLQPHRRTVRLLRGRAYFAVAHDPRRPFVVDSAGGSARVLGTRFDVRVEDDTAQVDVVEGRVAVAPPAGPAEAVLAAGERAWLGGSTIRRQARRTPLQITAWQRHQLVAYNTPLAQLVDELARYRHGVVHVRGEALRALPVSGAFNIADPEAGLQVLLDSLQLKALRLGPLTVVYRPGTPPAGAPRK